LTRTIFDVFNCTPTFPPDGRLYLTVANHEQCGIPGGTQLTLLPYAVAGLIVYSFGYPAFIGYVLYKNRELCMLDQLLRAKGTGDDRLSNPNAYALRMTYGRQYFQFKPDWHFWILAVIVRKFFIAITAVVFSKNSSFQMAACLMIMFLAYSAQMMVRPYMSAGEYDTVLASHAESAFKSAIHSRLRQSIKGIEARGRKKVRKNLLTFEGTLDRTAILGLLTGWLFNYNTVEQLMIFASVIVCLMGIMYQANTTSSFYPGALDGVTAVVMITIISAIVYFFVVVVTEMWILYDEDNRERKQKQAASSRKNLGDKDGKIKSVASNRLVNTEGVVETGTVDNVMNPLLLSAQRNASSKAASTSVYDSLIAQQPMAPNQEMWEIFRSEYSDLVSALKIANNESSELRMKVEGIDDEVRAVEVKKVVLSTIGKKAFSSTTTSSPRSGASPISYNSTKSNYAPTSAM
jgi:hypothetical protein